MAECAPYFEGCLGPCKLAGLAFMVSMGILMQILGCALYSNWWPMLSALMYMIIPMPFLFFGDSTSDFLMMSGDGEWQDIGQFLTGFSAIGSLAIPAILYHAQVIKLGAMILELLSFAMLAGAVVVFQKVSQDNDWTV